MYNVVAGDTFSLISRKVYGTETESGLLISANPDAIGPLIPGTVLVTPDSPLLLKDKISAGATSGVDEVAILIQGVRFRFWLNTEITLTFDNLSTVRFTAPFTPEDPAFRAVFKPFSYKSVVITVGGDPVFTGVIVGVTPKVDTESRVVEVTCYATPGVTADCTASPGSYPLEFTNQKLDNIAVQICKSFGVRVVFEDSAGATFDSVALKPSDKVFAFLTKLAKQRGLVITNDVLGSLVFRKSPVFGVPVARLIEGESPLSNVEPNFNAQGYYSSITGIEPTLVGILGSKYVARNPHLPGVLRPMTFEFDDSTQGDVKTASEAKLGRMFGSMVSYNISVLTWRDPLGSLWEPGTFLTLQADGAMIYSEYTFLIRQVAFRRSGDSSIAGLTLVMPGAFSGEAPKSLPWD